MYHNHYMKIVVIFLFLTFHHKISMGTFKLQFKSHEGKRSQEEIDSTLHFLFLSILDILQSLLFTST